MNSGKPSSQLLCPLSSLCQTAFTAVGSAFALSVIPTCFSDSAIPDPLELNFHGGVWLCGRFGLRLGHLHVVFLRRQNMSSEMSSGRNYVGKWWRMIWSAWFWFDCFLHLPDERFLLLPDLLNLLITNLFPLHPELLKSLASSSGPWRTMCHPRLTRFWAQWAANSPILIHAIQKQNRLMASYKMMWSRQWPLRHCGWHPWSIELAIFQTIKSSMFMPVKNALNPLLKSLF